MSRDEAMDEDEREALDRDEQEWPRCQCPYCMCSDEGGPGGGICDNCRVGAHQG